MHVRLRMSKAGKPNGLRHVSHHMRVMKPSLELIGLNSGYVLFSERLLGALLSVRVFLFHYDEPAILIPEITGLILGFGLAAAQSGDSFWHSLFRRWWMWR